MENAGSGGRVLHKKSLRYAAEECRLEQKFRDEKSACFWLGLAPVTAVQLGVAGTRSFTTLSMFIVGCWNKTKGIPSQQSKIRVGAALGAVLISIWGCEKPSALRELCCYFKEKGA
jgi:hypothetical protein